MEAPPLELAAPTEPRPRHAVQREAKKLSSVLVANGWVCAHENGSRVAFGNTNVAHIVRKTPAHWRVEATGSVGSRRVAAPQLWTRPWVVRLVGALVGRREPFIKGSLSMLAEDEQLRAAVFALLHMNDVGAARELLRRALQARARS